MSELVTICVDCGSEFSDADGWLDRCTMCCVVLEDHGSGAHATYVFDCFLCDDDRGGTAGADLQRAVSESSRAA